MYRVVYNAVRERTFLYKDSVEIGYTTGFNIRQMLVSCLMALDIKQLYQGYCVLRKYSYALLSSLHYEDFHIADYNSNIMASEEDMVKEYTIINKAYIENEVEML